MFSKDYAEYIITAQLSDEFIETAMKIMQLVPETGILEMTIPEISAHIGIDKESLDTTLKIMQTHKNPLCKLVNNRYIFDYPEKDIEYVMRFRRAISNWGVGGFGQSY